MRNMTTIGLLLGALALPAYADPPAARDSGSGAEGNADAHRLGETAGLGAPADDGSAQLGAKRGVSAGASSGRAGVNTSAGAGANASRTPKPRGKDYRVDVDASDGSEPGARRTGAKEKHRASADRDDAAAGSDRR